MTIYAPKQETLAQQSTRHSKRPERLLQTFYYSASSNLTELYNNTFGGQRRHYTVCLLHCPRARMSLPQKKNRNGTGIRIAAKQPNTVVPQLTPML